MNAYPEDLSEKIVDAPRRGVTKTEAARASGVSRSSVKRYAKLVDEGRPLAPKRRPGLKPKLDGAAGRLLEADVEECPSATLSERRESTVSRALKRLRFSQKKIAGSGRA